MKIAMGTWIVAGVALASSGVYAAEPAPAAAAPWKTTLSAGATTTDGNTKTMKANASLLVEGEKASLGSVRAGAEANYGESRVESETRTDVDNTKAFVNVRKTLSARTFAYIDASALYDDIAEVDYRYTAGPGVGVYLIKNEDTGLSIELGPSHVWEKKADVVDNYWALRAAERMDQKLGATAKCWQSAEYLAQMDDLERYLISAEIGIEAAVNSRVSVRLVVQDKYDSEPGPNLESNDVTFIGGASVKL